MAEMDYIELSKKEKLWAPSEYAWECLKCPLKVRVLDGFIDPSKGTALTERCRERNRRELFRAIGLIAFGQKFRPMHVETMTQTEGAMGHEVVPQNWVPMEAGATASAGPA